MRSKEIDHLVAHVQRKETVRIVAGREFGRTTMLRKLAETLASQGFTVQRVEGDAALASFKYGALRDQIIAPERLAQCSTPHEVRGVVEATLTRNPNTVLLIDDAEDLDTATAEALAPLIAAKRVVGVIVTAPFDHMTRVQRKTAQLMRAGIRLELSPLSFEQTGVLAQQFLQGPVSPAVASEVFSLSSGITGIAADILRSAQTSGAVRLTLGRWELRPEGLWNHNLEETAERLLAPLETAQLLLIHALAIAGNLPVSQLHALDSAAATKLTQHGLIAIFVDPIGIPQATPRPALITDYFRSRPLDMIRADALNMLHQGTKSGVITSGKKDYEFERHITLADAELAQNAGLARYLRERNQRALESSARKWRERPNAAHALHYLEALLCSPSYPVAAPEILARTESGAPGPKTLLQLAFHEVTLSRMRPPIAMPHSEQLRKLSPEYARALDALGMYWLFCDFGLTPGVTEWLTGDPTDPFGLSETVAAHIRACSGTGSIESIIDTGGSRLPLQLVISEQTSLVARLWRGARADAVGVNIQNVERVASTLGPTPSLADYFVRAQDLAAHGRPREARKMLSHALAIGGLDLRYAQVYAATLRWSAYLHFQEGQLEIATALLEESSNYAAITGPLPGMRPAFGVCLETLFAGDITSASELLLAEAGACEKLSFIDASWSMAKLAFEVSPSEDALSSLDALAGHLPYSHAPQITAFARAALATDPSFISHIDQIKNGADLATAADLLDAIERQRQSLGSLPTDSYSRALAKAQQTLDLVREPLTRRFGRAPASDLDTLTPREREIAPLTATLTNREIAERLTLSVRTVENHVARAMKKLGISSRTELNTPFTSATSLSSSSS